MFFTKEEYDDVTLSELLGDHDIATEEYTPKRLGFLGILKNFFLFILVSAVAGGLLSIPPLMGVSGGMMAAVPVADYWKNLPAELPKVVIGEHNFIYDKNGEPIAEVWTEDRVPAKSLKDISPFAIQGLIDTEDQRFYDNKGFDPRGTLRAALSGKGGGSGITQQLVKNLQFYNLLGRSKQSDAVQQTYTRKIKELKMSLEYEKTHTKEEILLNYFNTVAFGGPNTSGIETASQYIFGKAAKDLTLAEAAALVGSAQNPSLHNLTKSGANPTWKDRQAIVLERMLAEGHITEKQAKDAKAEKLKIILKTSKGGNCYSSKYPFYCDYVMEYLLNSPRLGATEEERQAVLTKGGLHIKTHLDPQAMDMVTKYLKDGYGTTNRIIAPTAIVEPGTGGVVAFGANRDYGDGEGKTTINLANRPSGEGSSYKLFTLAAALNAGLTESDLDFPSAGCPLDPGPGYDAPAGGFKNSNSCNLQGGPMNYKQATAFSSNTWYVTLEMRIGVDKVKEFSKSVGLSAPDSITKRSLAYTLGTVGNTPIADAAAYATFINKGVYCPATPLISMTYSDGRAPAFPDGYNPAADACRAVMSPKSAGIVLKALRANVSGEVPGAFGLAANIDGWDNGGKSGTNQGTNTTWAHVTPYYAIFTNVYDMEKPARGIEGVIFQGSYHAWYENTGRDVATYFMRNMLEGKAKKSLAFDDPDTAFKPTPVNESDFFTVPSVVGMTPEAALNAMRHLGIQANVSKTYKPLPAGFPPGLIVAQSIPAGEKLSKSTQKTVELYIGK